MKTRSDEIRALLPKCNVGAAIDEAVAAIEAKVREWEVRREVLQQEYEAELFSAVEDELRGILEEIVDLSASIFEGLSVAVILRVEAIERTRTECEERDRLAWDAVFHTGARGKPSRRAEWDEFWKKADMLKSQVKLSKVALDDFFAAEAEREDESVLDGMLLAESLDDMLKRLKF